MPEDQEMNDHQPAPDRPLLHRLLHTMGELLLSFLFGGGVFFGLVEFICLGNSNCDDFGGIVFYLASFIVALLIWGGYLSLCKKFRDRLPARVKLDIATAIATVILWTAFFPT
jgi:hypothetical protein